MALRYNLISLIANLVLITGTVAIQARTLRKVPQPHTAPVEAKKKSANNKVPIVFPSYLIYTNGLEFLVRQFDASCVRILASRNLQSRKRSAVSLKTPLWQRLYEAGNKHGAVLKLSGKSYIQGLQNSFIIQEVPRFCFTVRVLLDERKDGARGTWVITSTNGFYLSARSGPRKEYTQAMLTFTFNNKHLYLNDKRYAYDFVRIEPHCNHLDFGQHKYHGSFVIGVVDDHCYVINEIDIEDYIFGVLNAESWPGWPIEVNKAFAIACRSYLVAKILEAEKKGLPYHIKNTNIHQTYNGTHAFARLKEAVDQTRGQVLTHGNKPILAMFDACCGGIIPAHMTDVDFTSAPYLARPYACTFCQSCKINTWQVNLSCDTLQELLKQTGKNIKRIKEIRVAKKDKAGIVKEVLVRGTDTKFTLTGKEFYSLLTQVKSFCFAIEHKGAEISLLGRGYGHHLGLCQWGARRMIDHGWQHRAILDFYYPGTVLKHLKVREG